MFQECICPNLFIKRESLMRFAKRLSLKPLPSTLFPFKKLVL